MLPGELRSKGHLLAETKVWKVLKEINSNAQKDRQYSSSLNLKLYKTDYFGHKIHYDQNEKLYRLVDVCARMAIQGRPLVMLQWQRKITLSFAMRYIYIYIYKYTYRFAI